MQSHIPVIVGPFPLPAHGVSVIDEKLAQTLAARGLAFACLDTSPGGMQRGMRYYVTKMSKILRAAWMILAADGTPRSYLFSLSGDFGLLFDCVLIACARLKGGRMAIYHHSTNYVVQDDARLRLLLRLAGPGALQVGCSAEMLAAIARRYRGKSPALVINNAAWIEMAEASPDMSREGVGDIVLGHLSNLTAEKGLYQAIATLEACLAAGLACRLVLAGGYGEPAAREAVEAAQKKLGNRLDYRGVVTGDAKKNFFGEIDYFLFPSRYRHETQSLVVPEALAAGVPVIAYDHRYVAELVGADGGLVVRADESFSGCAAQWLLSCKPTGLQCRKEDARRQFLVLVKTAAGQVDDLVGFLANDRASEMTPGQVA